MIVDNNYITNIILEIFPGKKLTFKDVASISTDYNSFNNVYGQGYCFHMHDGKVVNFTYGKHLDYNTMFFHLHMLLDDEELLFFCSKMFVDDLESLEKQVLEYAEMPVAPGFNIESKNNMYALIKAYFYFKGQEYIKQKLLHTIPTKVHPNAPENPVLKSGLAELRYESYALVNSIANSERAGKCITITPEIGWNINHPNSPKTPTLWEDIQYNAWLVENFQIGIMYA